MIAMKALRDDGWRVDEVKLREALGDSFDEKIGKDDLKKVLSNLDIKDFSESFLSEGISTKSLKGPIIVQLSKWENVSYPKINEHVQNNGVCSLIVTDGAKPTKAMTTEPLANISGETPYGTKILLTGDLKLENGILQLSPKNCKFIGGTVEKMVEKWKTERYSSNKDARNTSEAPKWTSITGKGTVTSAKEKDNFKSMAATAEIKPSENSEFEAARQQEIANLHSIRKNIPIAHVKLHDNVKNDNAEKEVEAPKQERVQAPLKQDKYESSNSAPRSNFRKGRNRDDTEDIRNYISRPSGNATLFDHIRTQIVDLPPEAPIHNTQIKQESAQVKYDNKGNNRRGNDPQGNRRNIGGRNNNRGGYNNTRQGGSSHAPRNEFAQMNISDSHQDRPYSSGNSNYRGSRGRGGGRGVGGKPFFNNFNNDNQFPPPNGQHLQFFTPPPPNMFQPTGYIPPRPQHIRNPNPSGIEAGTTVLAPFTDNNVRKTYYNNSRRR
jgi:hypothetical protein